MQEVNKNITHLHIKKDLPHHFLAEKIVLSSLLNNSEVISIAVNNLTIQTFYFKNHQEIYKAIVYMHTNKISLDFLSLSTFLHDKGLLKTIGGIKVLKELTEQIPNLTYFDQYIRLLQDKYSRRLLIQLGYKLVNSCYITNLSIENIIHDLETEFFNLSNQNEYSDILTSTELFSSVFLELKEKSLKPSFSGINSGFYDLDSITQGFQRSDLIIVAGRPSMGKTAFCLNVAINIVKGLKVPVLFFSLEMSKEQLIYRLLAHETGISNMRLRSGNISNRDWVELNTKIKLFSMLPLFINDTPTLSIQEIQSKIKKLIFQETKIGLIIIDYLQLMQNSDSNKNNRVQELSQITRSLKIIAREFQVPIIALSQLSRSVENRPNKRPILSDLRESGSIEQDADLVLMLYRDNYYNLLANGSDITELIITKHRNGPIGTVKLKFNSKYAKFSSNQ